ncbi:YdcF family protein [Nocardia sp. NPDC050710]|uniref:YdcF family protein n=1 Tax=Nocardia sp. NPDC050710 TaxID=3157220 RepID=UPI0034101CA5
MPSTSFPDNLRADIEILWHYNQMHHEVRPVDVGIGLGGHDIGVATYAADLYHRGIFPLIVFSGANAPTTIGRFPRGEAVHYREHALDSGVPDSAILIESNATNTGENIDYSRALLESLGYESISSVMLISRPYQERRSYAICRKRWPEVDVICTSLPLPLDDYVREIGDAVLMINMLVGDTQRIRVYADRGWAIEQHIPDTVRAAYTRLVDAGFTGRLLPD